MYNCFISRCNLFFLTADDAYSVNRTLRARGTVESWLYNVELAMYETVKM